MHLSGIPVVEQRYAQRGIPLAYMQASYNSVRIWVNSFKAFYGRWGHDRERPRMVYIEHLRIIRIGRLEFETNWFSGKVVILRSRKDGAVIALSEGGLPVRQDGYLSGTNDIWDARCWYTVFDETQTYYKGPVSYTHLDVYKRQDFEQRHKVVLLDTTAVSALSIEGNPIGQIMELCGEPYTIIGVVSKTSQFRPVIETLSEYCLLYTSSAV